MAAYVRVKDRDLLRRHVEALGSQVEVAARCGLSAQRFSQLVTGSSPVIRASSAAVIEDVLGVAPGALFVVDEPGLVRRFGGESAEDTATAEADIDTPEN